MITVKCPNCKYEVSIFSTQDAAEYLGISVYAVKYHIYKGHIVPQLMGHSLMFAKQQLDDPGFTKHLREQANDTN